MPGFSWFASILAAMASCRLSAAVVSAVSVWKPGGTTKNRPLRQLRLPINTDESIP